MPDIFDTNPLDKFMALFVGPNGGGKSIAIGSWKQKGSIYYFDYDGRMASVGNYYRSRNDLKRGQLIHDTYGPDNLFASLDKLNDFASSYCPHAAVVVDSFTAATVSAVTYSLKQRMPKTGKGAPAKTSGNMIIPDWDEYKGETVYITQMLDLCKAIAAKGIAVFWTAHPVTSTKISGEGGGMKVQMQTRYACYGAKTDSLIPIYFNEIYFFTTSWDFQTSINKRLCFTQPYNDIVAKTALNLPVQIDWTDGDFYSIFSAEIEKAYPSGVVPSDEQPNNEGEQKNDVNLSLSSMFNQA